MAPRSLAHDGRSRADALVASLVVAASAGMVFESGPLGAGVAAAVAVAWLAAGVPYAFAVGQAGLVVGLDGGPTTTPFAQTALVVLLFTDIAVGRTDAVDSAAVAVAAATTATLLLVDRAVASTLVAGLLILTLSGVAVYAIHRYERVALGLVGEAE